MFIKKRKYEIGLLAPDPEDIRDYQLAEIQEPLSVAELPVEYNLRDQMTPVGKQNWGTCTCWSACAVAEFWNSREYQRTIDLSEKFVYHNMKVMSGLWSIQGDYLVNALKSVCNQGAPETKDYPDIKESSWDKYAHAEPSKEIYEKALEYKGKTYWTVGKTLQEIKSAIYKNKCPVAIGMKWYKCFNRTEKDGRLPLPTGKASGGHAFVCVGWTKGKLWFKNSWALRYGDKGYFYIPIEDFSKYPIWNARVMLDITADKFEGWVATKYLSVDTYKKGTMVSPSTSLRLRNKPTTDSESITTLKQGERCEIVSNEVVKANGYNWQQLKVV